MGVAVSAAVLLPAVAAEPLRDDRGVAIALAAKPKRIVSLLPSFTESVCTIGACGLLVGTDRYSNWPERVVTLPKLGGLDDAQVEAIVQLRPDVVLASSSARIVERLESLGVAVIVLESRNRGDVRRTLELLGQLLGATAAADDAWSTLQRRTRVAAERVPAAVRGRRVYFEVDATPHAAGAASFLGETLTQLGMVNAVGAELGPFPRLNPEHVVRLDPDVVMAVAPALAQMPQRPGWASLRALRLRQTCAFASHRFELLIRPGPRMGEGAEIVADCLAGLPTAP